MARADDLAVALSKVEGTAQSIATKLTVSDKPIEVREAVVQLAACVRNLATHAKGVLFEVGRTQAALLQLETKIIDLSSGIRDLSEKIDRLMAAPEQ